MCFSAAPTAHPTTDVQAILTVIGRRDKNRDALALSGTCLVNTDLTNMDLTGGNLTNADLFGVKQFRRCGDRRTAAVLTC